MSEDTRTKIGILGMGAIGTCLAASLKKNQNNQLYYYTRSDQKDSTIWVNGTFEAWNWEPEYINNQSITLDWLFVCLKEYHIKTAKESIQDWLPPNTKLVIIRNGLFLQEDWLSFIPASNMVACVIDCPVQPLSPRKYKRLSSPKLHSSMEDLASSLSPVFEKTDITFTQSANHHQLSWYKLIESASLGAVLCYYDDTVRIFENEECLQLYMDVMAESVRVAKAEGISFEEDFEDSMLKKLKSYPPFKGSSMLTDMRNDKPIEWMAKNGIILQLANKHGMTCPMTEKIAQKLASKLS